MRPIKNKISIFLFGCLITIALVAFPGCKKSRWCACYCSNYTYIELTTEQECIDLAKQYPDCDCEWD